MKRGSTKGWFLLFNERCWIGNELLKKKKVLNGHANLSKYLKHYKIWMFIFNIVIVIRT